MSFLILFNSIYLFFMLFFFLSGGGGMRVGNDYQVKVPSFDPGEFEFLRK